MTEPGIEEWSEHATAFDRVRSVSQTVSEPRTAPWIADRAAVSENTARGHLERLVEMNVLLEYAADGPTTYGPDPLHARLQTLRGLLNEYDHEGLVGLKADLQRRIEDWRDEYDVETPAALRESAAGTETAEETTAVRRTANDWELTEYRLGVVEEAIENYAVYSRSDPASA